MLNVYRANVKLLKEHLLDEFQFYRREKPMDCLRCLWGIKNKDPRGWKNHQFLETVVQNVVIMIILISFNLCHHMPFADV
jgi:hypothetical protein